MPDFDKITNLLNANGIEARISHYTGPRCIQAWGITTNALGLYVNDVFVCPTDPEAYELPYLMLAEDFCGYYATLKEALQYAVLWSDITDAESLKQWQFVLDNEAAFI